MKLVFLFVTKGTAGDSAPPTAQSASSRCFSGGAFSFRLKGGFFFLILSKNVEDWMLLVSDKQVQFQVRFLLYKF